MEDDASSNRGNRIGAKILWVVVLALPWLAVFLFPEWIKVAGGWLWVLLAVYLLFAIWLTRRIAVPSAERARPAGPRLLLAEEQPEAVRAVMDVRLAQDENGVQVFRGPLRIPADEAHGVLKAAFEPHAVPMLQHDSQVGAAIYLLPRRVEEEALEKPSRPLINWLLFFLTIGTTTWAGAAHQGVNLLAEPSRFAVGLPYALGLLTILGFHEMGHYLTARRYGMRVSPPFFIPVPFALGTFGAFIQMKSPSENRRALFDVAVAGPLAGLLVAVPALLIGLRTSTVVPLAGFVGDSQDFFGGGTIKASIFFTVIAQSVFGSELTDGSVLQLSPLAFAGWLGLFITGLNLLPVGQLDGGHMAHAMFGHRGGERISAVAMWSLLLLGLFVWHGLLMWAILVFFIAGRSVPPLNDLTPLGSGRRWLGYFVFVLLVAIMMPMPEGFLGR